MTTEILSMLAGNAGAIVLLGAVLLVVLPSMEKRHRREREATDRRHEETIKRIVESGTEQTQTLCAEINRNTRAVIGHSKACMVRTLTASGMAPDEAIRETERQIVNGRT